MRKTFLIIIGLVVILIFIVINSNQKGDDSATQTTEEKTETAERKLKFQKNKALKELNIEEIEKRLKDKLSGFTRAEIELKERNGKFDIYVDYNGYGDEDQAGVIVQTVEFVGRDMIDILEKFGQIYFLRFGEKELGLMGPASALIMLQETPEEKEASLRKHVKPVKK